MEGQLRPRQAVTMKKVANLDLMHACSHRAGSRTNQLLAFIVFFALSGVVWIGDFSPNPGVACPIPRLLDRGLDSVRNVI
jgi:hypothetical protein